MPKTCKLDTHLQSTVMDCVRNLIVIGRKNGYVSHANIEQYLPSEFWDADIIDNILTNLDELGIQVVDTPRQSIYNNVIRNSAGAGVGNDGTIFPIEEGMSVIVPAIDETSVYAEDPECVEDVPMSELVHLYLREIGKVPLLNRTKELELAIRIKAGDVDAKDLRTVRSTPWKRSASVMESRGNVFVRSRPKP